MFARTDITYLMAMQLLVGSLIIILLRSGVICDDPLTTGIEPSSTPFSVTNAFSQFETPVTSYVTLTTEEATSTTPEVVNNALSASTDLDETVSSSKQHPFENEHGTQSSMASDGSGTFITLQTTPLLTLNGRDFYMKVVPLTEDHPYLTESPPTTQSPELNVVVSEATGQSAISDTTPFITITDDKSFAGQIAKKAAVSSNATVRLNDSKNDTFFTTISSQDSTTLSDSLDTSPTKSLEALVSVEPRSTSTLGEQEKSTAYPRYTSNKDRSTNSPSSSGWNLYLSSLASGINGFEEITTKAEGMKQDASTSYSEAALGQSQTESSNQKTVTTHSTSPELDKTTSTPQIDTLKVKSSIAVASTDMFSKGYDRVTLFGSSTISMTFKEDTKPSQTVEVLPKDANIQSTTTKNIYGPSRVTYASGHTTESVNLDLSKATNSTGDSMKSTVTGVDDQELVRYTTLSAETGIFNVGRLSSTQNSTTLRSISSITNGGQDSSEIEAVRELTTPSHEIEHTTEIMTASPMKDTSSDSTRVTHISLTSHESLAPGGATRDSTKSKYEFDDDKSHFTRTFPPAFSTAPATLPRLGESTKIVSATTDELGSNPAGTEQHLNLKRPHLTSLVAERAPEVPLSISSSYATQQSEHESTSHLLPTPPSEHVSRSEDGTDPFPYPSNDNDLEKKDKSLLLHNSTPSDTTQVEEVITIQSVSSISPSQSIEDETNRSTSPSPQSLPVTEVPGNFIEDFSKMTESSTIILTTFNSRGTMEIGGVGKDKTIALEGADISVPTDLTQESITSQKVPSTVYTASVQPAAPERPKTKRFTVQPQPQPGGTDPEGMTVTTAISMGLIFIFLLILFCILAISLIAGWVHCRGREGGRPKVSLIRVERGLTTELANGWNKGSPVHAWMNSQSGTATTPHASDAQLSRSIPYSPSSPPPPPSFQCGCKRRSIFGSANRLCMIHGDPSARRNTSAVRAVKIISLTDDSDGEEVGTVLLKDLGRCRASGTSNAANEGTLDHECRSGGRRLSEWLYIDEA
ncbi:unnamed protein product [Hydatigera taeniaeformis]|uniref:EGF-like domain-containing protein n=1 Tax=Hydatigena taeniaeformis TaxID=6205 RepID=A0A0R3X6G3_HYDTA|nr:unnamed protein product [Hydatigera taeniaeformis]